MELDCHTSRAITGRTVLFRSLSRLHNFTDGADLSQLQCSLALFHWVLLLIVAVRNDSNLTKISCGLRLAGDSLQPLCAPCCAPWPRLKPLPVRTLSTHQRMGAARYSFRAYRKTGAIANTLNTGLATGGTHDYSATALSAAGRKPGSRESALVQSRSDPRSRGRREARTQSHIRWICKCLR